DRGIEPEIVPYIETPPSADELREILRLLGLGPRDIIRKGEKVYKELELGDPDLPDSALITAMVEHPILIERPIVISGGKARLGRPPEKVLEIL
ncbi:MAG: arsenate reductase (glutaredoxin), partial [Alphaproteobacteria bacterium]